MNKSYIDMVINFGDFHMGIYVWEMGIHSLYIAFFQTVFQP